jgi:SNF2 family DNA or RNA helicase
VLLTSYESLFRDFFELAKIEWQAFFIDEGQKLKNNNSKLFKKCQALKTHFKVLLSGTPLQNGFDELFNLLSFLDPVKFNQTFRANLTALRTQNLQTLGSAKDEKKKADVGLENENPEQEKKEEDNKTSEKENFV